MQSDVSYSIGGALANNITAPATLTTTEADLFIVVRNDQVKKSQFSIFLSSASGINATFYYYASPDNGVTWYPIPLYNTSTGELTQRLALLDAGSYTANSKYSAVDNIQVGAYTQFKVTGKSASGTPTYGAIVCGRDN